MEKLHTTRCPAEETVVPGKVGDEPHRVRGLRGDQLFGVEQRRDTQLHLCGLKRLRRKICRQNRSQWLLKQFGALIWNWMKPKKMWPVWGHEKRTHQLVIVISVISGERAEISAAKWRKRETLTEIRLFKCYQCGALNKKWVNIMEYVFMT